MIQIKTRNTAWQWGSSPSVLLHPRTNPLQCWKLNVGEFRTAVTFLAASPVCWGAGVRKWLISSGGVQLITSRQSRGTEEVSGCFEPQPSISVLVWRHLLSENRLLTFSSWENSSLCFQAVKVRFHCLFFFFFNSDWGGGLSGIGA